MNELLADTQRLFNPVIRRTDELLDELAYLRLLIQFMPSGTPTGTAPQPMRKGRTEQQQSTDDK